MQKIIPHLWFDSQAKEAANFYTSIFPESKITSTSVIHNTPSGDCDIVAFDLWGYSFLSISAGPFFKPNPAISFMVNFDPSRMTDAKAKLDEVWSKLSEGGKVLMPLDKYPYSDHYGWIQDKYGFSWQLMLTNPAGEPRPPIIPSLMFANKKCGKAEEATNFYIETFKNSKRGLMAKYAAGMAPHMEGNVMFTDFQLEGGWFAAMDAPGTHEFDFNEAISLMVNCDTQEEIDYYWNKLSAVPEAEQCGWLADKYGVSWQISPAEMNTMMQGTPKQVERVTKAFLQMKKFDLAKLRATYEGK